MDKRRLGGLIVGLTVLLAGCGFQLRGVNPQQPLFPFERLAVQSNLSSPLTAALARELTLLPALQVGVDPKQAQVTLQILQEEREKRILSLNVAGKVREYQLVYRVQYRVLNTAGQALGLDQQITVLRDMSFNDALVLAKDQEEVLLYQHMYRDAAAQLVRRLAKVNPQVTLEVD